MEPKKIHEITFETDLTIKAATLAKLDEWVMLLSNGQVIRHKVGQHSGSHLLSLDPALDPANQMNYTDGGFALDAPTTIYTLDDIVVIVNDYKTHGYVSYPGKYDSVHLWREDYYAHISRYPVALFKNEAGVPHLIYGKGWNHLQIMNLDTMQILTAAKSLILENAEEEHLKFVARTGERDQHPWPTPYSYFYGQLLMSPDNRKFMSKGWVWGSLDAYNVYDVANFISNHRIADQPLGFWEHNNRAACWVDNNYLAVVYSPFEEGDEGSSENTPVQIHVYDTRSHSPEITHRIIFETSELIDVGELFYSRKYDAFIALSKQGGLTVCNTGGRILLREPGFIPDTFYPDLNAFITVKGKRIAVHQL